MFCIGTSFENTLLKEREGRVEVMGKLKEKAVDHTPCRNGFEIGCGPVVRLTTE